MNPERRSPHTSGLARNASINLIGGIFAPAASFATGPILAHALSVDGRGELAAAIMPLSVIVTVATIGLPEAVTYFVAQDPRRTRMLFTRASLLILIPAILATVILFFSSFWISDGNPTVRRLIILSGAFVAPSLLLCVVRAIAAAHNRWIAITIERMITAACRLIPLITLFATGHLDLVAAAVVAFIASIAGVIAYIPLIALKTHTSLDSRVSTKQVLSYGGGIWIGSIAGILLMRIDQVLLSPLSGVYALGLYTVAVSISELPLIVNSAIRETAFTRFSSREAQPGEIGDLSRVSTVLVLALSLPVAAIAPVLIPALFGHEFSASVPVLLILLLAVVIGNPGSIAGMGLSSSGHPHLRSWSLVTACAVNIVLVFLLAPPFGAIGAALATLLGNAISGNMNIAWMHAKRYATVNDFYNFRAKDFATLAQIVRRVFLTIRRKVTHR